MASPVMTYMWEASGGYFLLLDGLLTQSKFPVNVSIVLL